MSQKRAAKVARRKKKRARKLIRSADDLICLKVTPGGLAVNQRINMRKKELGRELDDAEIAAMLGDPNDLELARMWRVIAQDMGLPQQ